MSKPVPPTPVTVVPDKRPSEVVIINHSPLFYWWPVWVVGFLAAAISMWRGQQVAFVPSGTVAERQVQIEGHEGPRDVLVAPAGRRLPAATTTDELTQPRLKMVENTDLGIVWAMTLLMVIVVTHVEMRGVWSLVVLVLIGVVTVLLAALGLWDPILRALRIIDIHMNALGYFTISSVLLVVWLLMFFVFDRLKYMIFTRGRLRVRRVIGEGEKVFDMRGMVFERRRDDLFRHWLLGFGTADLMVYTSGAKDQQMDMANVFGISRKLALINTMLQEVEVTKGR